MNTPVLVHVYTHKGKGNKLAEKDAIKYYSLGGRKNKINTSSSPDYSKVFGHSIAQLAEKDENIIGRIKNLNSFRIKFNNKLNKLLLDLKKKGKEVYGMGAAPRACVMLNSCRLTKNEIGLVGEVPQSLKCNKYVPGTDIMVKDENKIITDKPDYVIILAWHLKKIIINLLLKKRYKGNFIIPLPKLKIINSKKLL